jgi:hypothetical protein
MRNGLSFLLIVCACMPDMKGRIVVFLVVNAIYGLFEMHLPSCLGIEFAAPVKYPVSHALKVTAGNFSSKSYFKYCLFTSADFPGLTSPVGYFNYRSFMKQLNISLRLKCKSIDS